VFGDFALATTLRTLEQGYVAAQRPDTVPGMVALIRERYDLKDPRLQAVS
jgi:hypothetical protein